MKGKLQYAIRLLFGLPKTIVFNLHYFGVRGGVKLPCLLSSKVKLKSLRGTVNISGKYTFGMIQLGFPGSEKFDNSQLSMLWINTGKISFDGKASICNGCVIRNYGELRFGNSFKANSLSTFLCYKKIEFGNDCLVGWDCQFLDGDAHRVINLETGCVVNENEPIEIGNHVWLGAYCKVYKGVRIASDSVIAANTVLTHSFEDGNVIIGGSPNRIIKSGVDWKV